MNPRPLDYESGGRRPSPSHTPPLASADDALQSHPVSPRPASSGVSWSQSRSRGCTGCRRREPTTDPPLSLPVIRHECLTSLRANRGCWHGPTMSISVTLTPAPGCSPRRLCLGTGGTRLPSRTVAAGLTCDVRYPPYARRSAVGRDRSDRAITGFCVLLRACHQMEQMTCCLSSQQIRLGRHGAGHREWRWPVSAMVALLVTRGPAQGRCRSGGRAARTASVAGTSSALPAATWWRAARSRAPRWRR